MNKKILSVVLILCVMLAVMPMTAYAADRALCPNCNQVQTVRVTSQYADGKWHLRLVTCTVCNKEWDFLASHNWSARRKTEKEHSAAKSVTSRISMPKRKSGLSQP